MSLPTVQAQFLAELDREVQRSRRALELIPAGKHDWKPHDKSMIFGYLAEMVATIPGWLTMILTQPSLDVAPKDGHKRDTPQMDSAADYVAALDKSAAGAKAALAKTTDAQLLENWQLLAGGQVVMDTSRLEMLRDTINHWAHHRGQMTVYLRLMGADVPALYGPSADDKRFDL